MRGIKIKNFKDLTKDKDVIIFDARYVYIPVMDATLNVRRGSNVLVGSVLATDSKWDMPILSSVSGKVVDYEEKYCYTGEMVRTIKIENNFKNEHVECDTKPIDEYTKEEFVDMLKKFAVRGMSGANFPTYIKYQNSEIDNLIINAVECSPYITADYALMKENLDTILKTIDAIMKINNIKKAYFAIKENNSDIIKELNIKLKDYKNIKISKIKNLYPAGWERNLVNEIIGKDYKNIPLEIHTVVNNVTTIMSINDALNGRYTSRRIVTFAGDGLKKNANASMLIGQDISFVLDELGHKKRNLVLVVDGPMMGKTIKEENFVITGNVNSVLLLKKMDDEFVSPCIRCGRCNLVCPVGLTPIMIKENINNIKMLKELKAEKCIECGLCSYVCPAKIMLKEHVINAKKNVRDKDETRN